MNPIIEIDLSGQWEFTPEGGERTRIHVPGGGWQKQGFVCEAGVYQTKITVPDTGGEVHSVVRLEVGAINHHAQFYLGADEDSLQLVHEEVTAFTPQAADLSRYVRPGGVYVLQIRVRSHRDGRPIAPHWAEWCDDVIARGIFRSVHLRLYPGVRVSDAFVRTSVRDDAIRYEAWVANATDRRQTVALHGSFRSWNGIDWPYPALPDLVAELEAGETKRIVSPPIRWGLGSASYWQPNVPYRDGYRAQLHILRLRVESGGAAAHTADVRFGFREIRQAGPYYELNGVRVNFRGDNLQVANYDRIDYGGRGDAIDTLPGFLPPCADNPGWPQAVDNFLRLNFNVQRQHMGPWTPYMLDVCDERGLMLLGESACRWDGFDMEDGRGFHEVKCLQDIVRRDRNHPAIVRWSTKNETQCLDPGYHVELYEAVRALDNTRPIYEDIIVSDREKFNVDTVFAPLLDKGDFSWIEHYISYQEADTGEPGDEVYFTVIEHNDAVVPLRDRPFGIGEANWMRSSTCGGLTLFAATIALVRAQNGSDVRPYVLLSSWASSIPGVRTTDFVTEENRHPVYGEDNLPDPWSHPGIRLMQQACSPYLAMDVEFWRLNRRGNAHGHFPVRSPQLAANATVLREITVFNDDTAGSELELEWQVREGSTFNWVLDRGLTQLAIEPGYHAKVAVTFRTPAFNTFLFLQLTVRKQGRIVFEDRLTAYEITGGTDFKPAFNGEARKFV